MKIYKLPHKIAIHTLTETMKGDSETERVFKPIYHGWANIKCINGSITFNGKQTAEHITHEITVRYKKNITTENWVQYMTRYFRIRSVINIDEKNRYLKLLCKEE